jgi:transcriptional regulator with XRE-family HTH domain
MLNKGNRQTEARGDAHFSPSLAHLNPSLSSGGPMRKDKEGGEPTPLAVFVRRRLEELDLKQSDFCRLSGFDQGLLSKIQNSIISSLSLESTLRLSIGLKVSPRVLFGLTNRTDMQDLVLKAYAMEFFPELSKMNGIEIPAPVLEITKMAFCAYSMGRSLAPAQAILSYLTVVRHGSRDKQAPSALLAEAYGL